MIIFQTSKHPGSLLGSIWQRGHLKVDHWVAICIIRFWNTFLFQVLSQSPLRLEITLLKPAANCVCWINCFHSCMMGMLCWDEEEKVELTRRKDKLRRKVALFIHTLCRYHNTSTALFKGCCWLPQGDHLGTNNCITGYRGLSKNCSFPLNISQNTLLILTCSQILPKLCWESGRIYIWRAFSIYVFIEFHESSFQCISLGILHCSASISPRGRMHNEPEKEIWQDQSPRISWNFRFGTNIQNSWPWPLVTSEPVTQQP